MAVRFVFKGAGVHDILISEAVADDLEIRADRVAQQARSIAPVATGAYRNSIKVLSERHPSRQAAHVYANVAYAGVIEAKYRVLGRSIDAARG